MNRVDTLYESSDVAVRRFDHPPHERHDDPDDEVAPRWAIAFVQSGRFDVVEAGRRHRLAAGGVFVTHPGLHFRCAHDERCPTDVCTSVGLTPAAARVIEDVVARRPWVARRAATPRLAFVDRRLHMAITASDAFETERWSLAAVSALCADMSNGGTRGTYAVRRPELDAVVAACRAIELHPDARRTVAERARDVGLSSTALALGFARHVGVSPHRYVIRWRLAHAADLLSERASVTEACYASGFENLSHFCRVFLRSFGVRASAWRRVSPHERREKVQAMRMVGS